MGIHIQPLLQIKKVMSTLTNAEKLNSKPTAEATLLPRRRCHWSLSLPDGPQLHREPGVCSNGVIPFEHHCDHLCEGNLEAAHETPFLKKGVEGGLLL